MADSSKESSSNSASTSSSKALMMHLVSPAEFRARNANKKKRKRKSCGGARPMQPASGASASGRLSSVARRLLLKKIATDTSTELEDSERSSSSISNAQLSPWQPLDGGETSSTPSCSDAGIARLPPTIGECHHTSNGCSAIDGLNAHFQQTDRHVNSSVYRDSSDNCSYLIVTRDDRYFITSAGPIQTPRLCVKCDAQNITFSFQVFYKSIDVGPYDHEMAMSFLSQLHPHSSYVVCPGLRDYPNAIEFKTKNVRLWGEPFGRIDSQACRLWHIPNNSRQLPTSPLYNCCPSCKQLNHDIQQLLKRALNTTSRQREARKNSFSNYPLKYLSPADRSERITRKSRKQIYLKTKLKKIAPAASSVSVKVEEENGEMLLEETNQDSNCSELLSVVNQEEEEDWQDDDDTDDDDERLVAEHYNIDVVERTEFEQ